MKGLVIWSLSCCLFALDRRSSLWELCLWGLLLLTVTYHYFCICIVFANLYSTTHSIALTDWIRCFVSKVSESRIYSNRWWWDLKLWYNEVVLYSPINILSMYMYLWVDTREREAEEYQIHHMDGKAYLGVLLTVACIKTRSYQPNRNSITEHLSLFTLSFFPVKEVMFLYNDL